MMKEEFERMAGVQVTPDVYRIIDDAYNHPLFSGTRGKDLIVQYYKTGGMALMEVLAPIGAAYRDYYNSVLHLNQDENRVVEETRRAYQKDRDKLRSDFETRWGYILK